jgi:glycosyltransferase involved in cell wall biosynthesis
VKVLFFQPYLASWRIEFLERFRREFEGDVVVVDGGHSELVDAKSTYLNRASFDIIRLRSANRFFSYIGFPYPVYFSPGLIAVLFKERPDVVITEGEINLLNNILVYIYCAVCGKPYLWWSLGKVRTRPVGVLPRLLRPVVRYMLKGARRIVARNSFAKDYYIREMGIDRDKIVVAPNSVDEEKARRQLEASELARLRSSSSGPVLLYVGAMVAAKRPCDLIDVIPILDDLLPDLGRVEVWYVGDGPERRRVEEAVQNRGLSRRVKFFGRITDGVGNYFSAADVVVVPGLGGLVIHHAMIFGAPVVSRPADGTELDLIENDRTGVLVEDESIQGLAEAIERVLRCNMNGEMSGYILDKVNNEWNMALMISRFKEAIACNG